MEILTRMLLLLICKKSKWNYGASNEHVGVHKAPIDQIDKFLFLSKDHEHTISHNKPGEMLLFDLDRKQKPVFFLYINQSLKRCAKYHLSTKWAWWTACIAWSSNTGLPKSTHVYISGDFAAMCCNSKDSPWTTTVALSNSRAISNSTAHWCRIVSV